MKPFLKKIGLIDNLTITLPISKNEFINRLSDVIDEADISFISSPLADFITTDNKYKGKVNAEGFKIKRKRNFTERESTFVFATGTFTENNGQLTIETEIKGIHLLDFVLYLLLIIVYCTIFLFSFLKNTRINESIPIVFITFLTFFIVGMPYYRAKQGVSQLKYDLEREFVFLSAQT